MLKGLGNYVIALIDLSYESTCSPCTNLLEADLIAGSYLNLTASLRIRIGLGLVLQDKS